MSGARIVAGALVVLATVAFVVAAVIAGNARSFARESVLGTGTVTALNDGPLHAEVELTTADGRRVSYAENGSRVPLRVGEKLPVRYLPADPARTATVANGSPYALARGFALMGLAFLAAAFLSPLLVARFPGLFGFPIRP